MSIELAGLSLPARWLRDHGDDPGSVDPRSGQRLVDTFAIPADVAAVDVAVDTERAEVRWSDGVTTAHDLDRLRAVVADRRAPRPPLGREITIDRGMVPWSRAPEEPALLPATVLDDDAAWAGALARFRRDGWIMLEGVARGREPIDALAGRIGYPRRTIFGDVWEMRPGADEHLDSAYDTIALDVHTDGTYSHDAPGVIVFSQQERTGEGGASVLVDGFAVARDLSRVDPAAAELLTRFDIRGRYVEPGVDLVAERPVLGVDAGGVLRQVTFNNYDRAPLLPEPEWVDPVIDAYAAFHRLASEPGRALELEWEPGRMLLMDNWRLLHGRTAYTGGRRFVGMYTNHEDLESAWRLAGLL